MQSFNEWHKNKKSNLIQRWRSLNSTNYQVVPMRPKGNIKGTSYDDDGIRITGSQDFIDSILVRLKDLLNIEQNPNLRLDLRYVTTNYQDPNTKQPIYAVYINCKERDIHGRI